MEKTIEVKVEDIKRAFEEASDSVKESILTLFPQLKEILPITYRVKTFEDACHEIGIDPKQYMVKYNDGPADVVAYMKLRVICKALNEGWIPKFKNYEKRWYVWFALWTEEELLNRSDRWKADRHLISTSDYFGNYAGFAFSCSADTPMDSAAHFGSHLCFKNEALAMYCGKQFINLWADFCLTKK